jgi:hypothetical protein
VPGPLPPIEQITPDAFQFDDIARRELMRLLPLSLHQLDVPEDIKQAASKSAGAPKLKTIAELILVDTEKLIRDYLTEKQFGGSTPTNPANVRAAIRKLRKALEPFVRGWVDKETASIIPDQLDKQLAHREHELTKLRLAPYKRRRLDQLCQSIGVLLREFTLANQVTFEISGMIKFITTALDYAGIEYSYSKGNPSRFFARVFPKPNSK